MSLIFINSLTANKQFISIVQKFKVMKRILDKVHSVFSEIDVKSLPQYVIISVEGNIATGKTTTLQCLADNGFTVIPEPTDSIWTDKLALFYKNMEKYAFPFQIEALLWFSKIDSFLRNRIREDRPS